MEKPPHCAWCERLIEQPHDTRVLMGVSYHAACLDVRGQVLARDADDVAQNPDN